MNTELKAIAMLEKWLKINKSLTYQLYLRKNERYLHHWFSSEWEDKAEFGTAGKFHPEWPSWKKEIHENVDGHKTRIYYQKNGENVESEREAQPSVSQESTSREDEGILRQQILETVGRFKRVSGVDVKRGAAFTDFSLGDFLKPDVLLEFKWNSLFSEWAFDFYKILDRRLSAPWRLFFGVRGCSRSNPQAEKRINLYLEEIIASLNKNHVPGDERSKQFKCMIFDVNVRGKGLEYRTIQVEAPIGSDIRVTEWVTMRKVPA